MSQDSLIDAKRRLLLRNGAAIVLSGAAVALLAGREALAQSTTASPADLHNSAPTRFQDIGDIRLAYRRFGKEGATPVVCLQHFAGTMNNSDPIHTNRLAQDRPVILVDYRGVGRSEGQTPDSVPGLASDIIAFIRALGVKQVDVFGFSLGGFVAQQIALDAPELVRRLLLVGTGPAGGEGHAGVHPSGDRDHRPPEHHRRTTAARAVLRAHRHEPGSRQGLARTHHRAADRSRAESDAPGRPGGIRRDHAMGPGSRATATRPSKRSRSARSWSTEATTSWSRR